MFCKHNYILKYNIYEGRIMKKFEIRKNDGSNAKHLNTLKK